jgi:predicted dehydrogenase
MTGEIVLVFGNFLPKMAENPAWQSAALLLHYNPSHSHCKQKRRSVMVRPVRIGVIGCGSVMRNGYMPIAQALRAEGLAEVCMACDVNAALAPTIREQFAIPRFTTNYQEMLAAEDVDLVLVLTAPPTHGAIAHAALTAGKHVLVEKPMALDLAEAAALVTLAERSPGILLPAPHILLSPTYQQIARHLRAGDIGTVFSARGLCGHGGPSWGPWYYRLPGGGPLFDLAVYNITSLTGWLGPVRRVTALLGTAIPERIIAGERITVEAEDNAQLILDFGNATLAVITSSFTIQRYRDATLELYGTTGTIRLQGDDWAPDGYELWQHSTGAWQRIAETNPTWNYLSGLRHLVECIHTGQRPIITPAHAYHVLEVLLKAQIAGRTGQAQSVESDFSLPVFD